MVVDASALAARLRTDCAGEVLRPGDAGYEPALRGYVSQVRRRPGAVLIARDADDVANAVRIAAVRGATVGIFSTGHAMRAVPGDDLLIVTSALRLARDSAAENATEHAVGIDPEARTATVRAGTRWGEVAAAAEPHGLAPVRGSHASVGAMGYTLGGGLGPLGRSFGFAADHVRSFEVVTAAGERIAVNAEAHPELFWALRGGGRQGFAIVTGMTIGLVPAAEVYAGTVCFAASDAAGVAAVFNAYAAWAGTSSDALSSSLAIMRFPELPEIPVELRGGYALLLELCHTGLGAEAARECAVVQSFGTAILSDLRRRPFADSAIDAPPGPGWGGALGLSGVPRETIEIIAAELGPERDAPFAMAELRRLGGALRGDPHTPDAVAGRDAEYLIFLGGLPDPALITDATPRAARELFARLAPWATPSVPTNFADHLGAAELELTWPQPVRERLAAIRAEWDPAGMFRNWAG